VIWVEYTIMLAVIIITVSFLFWPERWERALARRRK
jgi:hypothetical protein